MPDRFCLTCQEKTPHARRRIGWTCEDCGRRSLWSSTLMAGLALFASAILCVLAFCVGIHLAFRAEVARFSDGLREGQEWMQKDQERLAEPRKPPSEELKRLNGAIEKHRTAPRFAAPPPGPEPALPPAPPGVQAAPAPLKPAAVPLADRAPFARALAEGVAPPQPEPTRPRLVLPAPPRRSHRKPVTVAPSRGPRLAAGQYRTARKAEEAGTTILARVLYAQIVKDHPGTPEAQLAEERLAVLDPP